MKNFQFCCEFLTQYIVLTGCLYIALTYTNNHSWPHRTQRQLAGFSIILSIICFGIGLAVALFTTLK